jgi:hypothetical protein
VQEGDIVRCSDSWLRSYGTKVTDAMREARGTVTDVWLGKVSRQLWVEVEWQDGSSPVLFPIMPVCGLEVVTEDDEG